MLVRPFLRDLLDGWGEVFARPLVRLVSGYVPVGSAVSAQISTQEVVVGRRRVSVGCESSLPGSEVICQQSIDGRSPRGSG
ncbi:MAG: hypothetical protein WBP81_02960, partial [Solirubrobacteraceae bacterium]